MIPPSRPLCDESPARARRREPREPGGDRYDGRVDPSVCPTSCATRKIIPSSTSSTPTPPPAWSEYENTVLSLALSVAATMLTRRPITRVIVFPSSSGSKASQELSGETNSRSGPSFPGRQSTTDCLVLARLDGTQPRHTSTSVAFTAYGAPSVADQLRCSLNPRLQHTCQPSR